jgi:predicted RNase H-like nuclease (RuvC/YqgF family)
MEQGFDLLEEKVRKAAELVKSLRKENRGLEDDLVRAKSRLGEAEKRLAAIEKEQAVAAGRTAGAEALEGEVKTLRRQRDEVKKRIERLVEVLESLDDEADAS